jgi:hypothetical protein
VIEGEPLPDGVVATVLARETDETFELDPAPEAELLLSLAEADRGELIPAEEVLKSVPGRRLTGRLRVSFTPRA